MKRTEQKYVTKEDLKHIIGKYQNKNVHVASKWYNACVVPASFDIETTEEFMYIWTFTILDTTIIGYTWAEFRELLWKLKGAMSLGKVVEVKDDEEKTKASRVLPVFVHNFGGFEWHFIKEEVTITDKFLKGPEIKKDPKTGKIKQLDPDALYAVAYGAFLFVDSYAVSNMSLDKLAKTYTTLQKSHDLDYSILRNHEDAKHLTEEEINYCCLDTQILSQFAQYFFDEYLLKYNKFPLTQNQIVNAVICGKYDELMKSLSKEEKTALLKEYNRDFIDQPTYRFVRTYGFRGGFCSSSGQYWKGIIGYADLDAAYTWSIIHGYFPRGNYHKGDVKSWKSYLKKCCQLKIRFKGLRAKEGWLLLESKTRIIMVSTNIEVSQSGKVKYAEDIIVSLTELDWKLYKKCYEWDSMEVLEVKWAERGRLPKYVIDGIIELYAKKAQLKHAGKENTPEYKRVKTLPSTVFGAMGKRVYGSDLDDLCKTDWYVKFKRAKLRPQWSVYVSAHVRYLMISMIMLLGYDYWLYTDTDSIYYIQTKETKDLFDRYNKEVRIDNKAFCDEFGYSYEDLCDLGTFDDESRHQLKIDEFITTSAKSYAYHYYDDDHPDGDYKIVMSGIPKEAVFDAWKKSGLSFAEFFCDQYQTVEFVRKKAVVVHNTQKVINGELMTCKCGVRIVDEPIKGSLRMVKNRLAIERVKEEIEDPRDYNFE